MLCVHLTRGRTMSMTGRAAGVSDVVAAGRCRHHGRGANQFQLSASAECLPEKRCERRMKKLCGA